MVSNKSFIAANIRGYVLGGRGSWISQLGQGARQLAVKRPLGYIPLNFPDAYKPVTTIYAVFSVFQYQPVPTSVKQSCRQHNGRAQNTINDPQKQLASIS